MLSGGGKGGAAWVGEQERLTSLLLGLPHPEVRPGCFQTRLTSAHRAGLCPVLARVESTQLPPTPRGLAPDNENTVQLGEAQGQSPSPNHCVILGKPLGVSEPSVCLCIRC